MRSLSKAGVWGMFVAGAASLIFSLHTVHIQKRSIGSRLAEAAVGLAHMWPDKIDDNYIRKMKRKNGREYIIPAGIIVDSDLESWFIDGMKVYRMSPENEGRKKCVLYLHGGGYINQPSLFHWWFLDRLVQETGTEFFVPIYPKAPGYSYRAAYSRMMKVYDGLVHKGYREISLMGDSAGGGLAFGFAQMLRNENMQQPKEIILLSPWLDISLGHKDIRKYEKKDPMLNVDNLRKIGGMWAGGSPPGSYQLSPMYGSFEGLGRISIFIGTREICFPDAAKLSHILNSEGIEHNYFEYNWMNHNFPLYPIKEGAASRAQIAELIR